MQFNVAQLLKESLGAQREHHLDEDFDPLEETGTSHVAGDLRLLRTDDGIWVCGVLDSNATSVCARCSETYEYPTTLNVDDVWYPVADINTGAKLSAPDEDAFVINAHHELDLTEAIRQYAVTSVPMKPLCQPDCPGICPSCGTSLKYEQCKCSRFQSDPRWGPLLDLLVKQQS
jgi:uncharacterized protein